MSNFFFIGRFREVGFGRDEDIVWIKLERSVSLYEMYWFFNKYICFNKYWMVVYSEKDWCSGIKWCLYCIIYKNYLVRNFSYKYKVIKCDIVGERIIIKYIYIV